MVVSEFSNCSLQYFVIGFGCGIFTGFLWFKKFNKPAQSAPNSQDFLNGSVAYDENSEYKMVLVVRNDLKMGKGKAAAQCAHAAVAGVKQCEKRCPDILKMWKKRGQAKIVVKIESEKEMLELGEAARQAGLLINIISDAGRTQIAAGSRTVMAVGPGSVKLINDVTGHLKLY